MWRIKPINGIPTIPIIMDIASKKNKNNFRQPGLRVIQISSVSFVLVFKNHTIRTLYFYIQRFDWLLLLFFFEYQYKNITRKPEILLMLFNLFPITLYKISTRYQTLTNIIGKRFISIRSFLGGND